MSHLLNSYNLSANVSFEFCKHEHYGNYFFKFVKTYPENLVELKLNSYQLNLIVQNSEYISRNVQNKTDSQPINLRSK